MEGGKKLHKKECGICRSIFYDSFYLKKEGAYYDSANMICKDCLSKGYDKDYKGWQKKFDKERMNAKVDEAPKINEGAIFRSTGESYYVRSVKEQKDNVDRKSMKLNILSILQDKIRNSNFLLNESDIKKLAKEILAKYDKINLGELKEGISTLGFKSILNDHIKEYIANKSFENFVDRAQKDRGIIKEGIRRIQ